MPAEENYWEEKAIQTAGLWQTAQGGRKLMAQQPLSGRGPMPTTAGLGHTEPVGGGVGGRCEFTVPGWRQNDTFAFKKKTLNSGPLEVPADTEH